jgi:hypothetical protein
LIDKSLTGEKASSIVPNTLSISLSCLEIFSASSDGWQGNDIYSGGIERSPNKGKNCNSSSSLNKRAAKVRTGQNINVLGSIENKLLAKASKYRRRPKAIPALSQVLDIGSGTFLSDSSTFISGELDHTLIPIP